MQMDLSKDDGRKIRPKESGTPADRVTRGIVLLAALIVAACSAGGRPGTGGTDYGVTASQLV